jgi:hypothetical protein
MGKDAGNCLATTAMGFGIISLVMIASSRSGASWTSWTQLKFERSTAATQCPRVGSCEECNIQYECGWCYTAGAKGGQGACMRGEKNGPMDRSGEIVDEMCPGLNVTRKQSTKIGSHWENDRTGCPGEADEQFGIQTTCIITHNTKVCKQNEGPLGVCEAWLADKIKFKQSAAHRNQPDILYCDSKPPLDVDLCSALEQLCGDRGRALRWAMTLLMAFIGGVVFCGWVIVTGCCIPGHIKYSPDSVSTFLRRLCVAGSLLSIVGLAMSLMVMSGWLAVHTRLTLAYRRDACIGDACPHLGTAFWSIFATGLLMFFSSLLFASQSMNVSSKMHGMLAELFTLGEDAKKYAAKKARYEYSAHRMGKEWAAANLTKPTLAAPSSNAMRHLAATQARMSGVAKGAAKGVSTGLGFLESAASSAGHRATRGLFSGAGSSSDDDAESMMPAQHNWVDPHDRHGGFRPDGGGRGRGRGRGRGAGSRGPSSRNLARPSDPPGGGKVAIIDKAISTHRIAV